MLVGFTSTRILALHFRSTAQEAQRYQKISSLKKKARLRVAYQVGLV
jgi:hypothetical protein